MRKLALRVERKRLMSAMLALIFCSSAMLGFLVTSSSDRTGVPVREDPIAARILALTVHDPILIDGNAGFTGLNASTGITRGSGTADDPYVIEGWEISSFPSNGIDIRSADVHFVIQDCYVHHGAGGYNTAAIYVNSCANGIIRNCTCSNNWYGVNLLHSYGMTLISNTFSDNNDGIYWLGGVAMVANNSLERNAWGIEVAWVSDSEIIGNNVAHNLIGISMENCQGMIVSDNCISENDFWGLGLSECTDHTLWSNVFVSDGILMGWNELPYLNSHIIAQNNTVNGKPIYYYKDGDDLTLNEVQIGQLIVVNYTNVCITNLTINNTDCGITMAYVANATVALSNVSDNDYGMIVRLCSGVHIDGNVAFNDHYSLNTCCLIDSTIVDNNVVDADNEAITLYSCQNTSVSGNSVVSSNDYGVYVRECENTTVIMNSIQGNAYGTIAYSCSNSTIAGNNFSGNAVGISFMYCTDDTVTINNVSTNDIGIYLESSDNNHLIYNTCMGNGVAVELLDSDSNEVIGNLISQSVGYGIYIVSGSMNAVFNNSFCENNGAGESCDPSHIQACDDGSDNWWNNTEGYGNYWSDWTSPDSEPDGIVDDPYLLDGSAGAQDHYPLTTAPEPIPEFGAIPLVVIGLLVAIVLGATRRKNV